MNPVPRTMRPDLARMLIDATKEDLDLAEENFGRNELSESLTNLDNAIMALKKARRMIAEGK